MTAVNILINFLKNFFLLKCSRRERPKSKWEILQKWYKPAKPLYKSIDPVITWIGQSTFLLQVAGINILTDPIFFHISPLFFRRLLPPGIPLGGLPNIDVIIISHDHADHMHKKSLLRLVRYNPLVLVPKGLYKRIKKLGFKNVVEHAVWDTHKMLKDKLKFTFLPASHWSGCNIFNVNKSKYGSWMIEHNKESIYFAGDTSYSSHFKEIAKKFTIGTALLPIGPLEPRQLVKHAHLDPEEAVQAFVDLKAQRFIPMHWGTFDFGLEKFEEPITKLKFWWNTKKDLLFRKKLSILKFGKSKNLTY